MAHRSIVYMLALLLPLHCAQAEPPEQLQHVATILTERCLACHGPTKQEGGYRLDSVARLRKPGDSGATPIVPSQAGQSELYKRITTSDSDLRMPAGAAPLNSSQITLIEKWIEQGAKVDPNYETKAITSFSKGSIKLPSPEHYPSTLPVTALALASADQSVSVWTSGYGEVLQWTATPDSAELAERVATTGSHVSDMDLSSDHRLMAVASGTPGAQGYIELFARSDSGYNVVWSQACPDVPADLSFAPDGPSAQSVQQLAVGQSDGTMLVVAIPVDHLEQTTTQTFAPHADAILALNWSEKGDRLITGSRDRTAKIFATDKWQLIANYDRHERAVGGVGYLDKYPVSLDETGKLRLWSGDDSDRTVAERDNQARFLEQLQTDDKRVWFAMAGDLRSFETERKTVDDGKDDEGKPKQKTTTRWKAGDELKSNSPAWLLSLDVHSQFIAAGNEQGEVILWQRGQSQPWSKFKAKP